MKRKDQTSDRVVFLRGQRTTLRPVEESDIPKLQKWINDPDIWKFLKRTFPLTQGDEREWLLSLQKKSDTNMVLIIEVGGRAIGTMALANINWKDRIATTGAVIGEKAYWGKGYGTDAKMALLDYAFNVLNLRKIMSRTVAFNKRSLAYSLHCGYRLEGRLVKQHYAQGRYWDELILGCFRHTWLPLWKEHCRRGARKNVRSVRTK
jgi:RimJ/RimL family protein N-acetyltransferase